MTCPNCNGSGVIQTPPWIKIDPDQIYHDQDCDVCGGTGEIEVRPESAEDGPITKWLMRLGLIGAGILTLYFYFQK